MNTLGDQKLVSTCRIGYFFNRRKGDEFVCFPFNRVSEGYFVHRPILIDGSIFSDGTVGGGASRLRSSPFVRGSKSPRRP